MLCPQVGRLVLFLPTDSCSLLVPHCPLLLAEKAEPWWLCSCPPAVAGKGQQNMYHLQIPGRGKHTYLLLLLKVAVHC